MEAVLGGIGVGLIAAWWVLTIAGVYGYFRRKGWPAPVAVLAAVPLGYLLAIVFGLLIPTGFFWGLMTSRPRDWPEIVRHTFRSLVALRLP